MRLLLAFVAVLLSTFFASASDSNFVHCDGTRLLDGKGRPLVLRGVNLGGWLMFEAWQCPMDASGLKDDWSARELLEKRFGRAERDRLLATYMDTWVTTQDLDNMKALGVNSIRLPFWYRNLQEEDGTWREDAFQRMDWLVEEAYKRGIYTILDLHGVPGGQSDSDNTGRIRKKKVNGLEPEFWKNEEFQKRALEIWEKVATHYRGNPAVAAYDLLNEPSGAPSREALWAVYDRFYKGIRAIDPDHVISMEGCWGGWWGGAYHGWGWGSLPDPKTFGWTNVLYQQHSYCWDFKDTEKQKANTDAVIADWKAHQSWGVPCYIGEFNCMAKEEAWRYTIEQYEANGLSWATWTYKATHGSGSDSWGVYNYNNPPPPKPNLEKDSAEEIQSKWAAWNLSAFHLNPMLERVLKFKPE